MDLVAQSRARQAGTDLGLAQRSLRKGTNVDARARGSKSEAKDKGPNKGGAAVGPGEASRDYVAGGCSRIAEAAEDAEAGADPSGYTGVDADIQPVRC